MKKPRRKPTVESAVRQLQRAFMTTGKAVRHLQRRLDRLERRDRVIKGFSPSVDCGSIEVEEDDES